jgi:hypothetical protein
MVGGPNFALLISFYLKTRPDKLRTIAKGARGNDKIC